MKTLTVAEFIAHCQIDPFEAVAATRINIQHLGDRFEIMNHYGFSGPVEFDNDADRNEPTKQQIAHTLLPEFLQRYDFDPVVPSGAYIRWANDLDEIEIARRGELRCSVSHFPGSTRKEPGVSVSAGPWLYGFGKLYCYFVQGELAGIGSDGEPCVVGKSISIYSDAKTPGRALPREWVFQQFYWRNEYRLASMAAQRGIAGATLMAFMLGGAHCDHWYPRRAAGAA
jgi:hypothetical protein